MIAKGGPEKAVDVCHLKALPLTGEILSGMPRITGVKRTSLRIRNPANTPDAAEQMALLRVEKDMKAGVLPKVLVQRITQRPPGNTAEEPAAQPVHGDPGTGAPHDSAGSMRAARPERREERAELRDPERGQERREQTEAQGHAAVADGHDDEPV